MQNHKVNLALSIAIHLYIKTISLCPFVKRYESTNTEQQKDGLKEQTSEKKSIWHFVPTKRKLPGLKFK